MSYSELLIFRANIDGWAVGLYSVSEHRSILAVITSCLIYTRALLEYVIRLLLVYVIAFCYQDVTVRKIRGR